MESPIRNYFKLKPVEVKQNKQKDYERRNAYAITSYLALNFSVAQPIPMFCDIESIVKPTVKLDHDLLLLVRQQADEPAGVQLPVPGTARPRHQAGHCQADLRGVP